MTLLFPSILLFAASAPLAASAMLLNPVALDALTSSPTGQTCAILVALSAFLLLTTLRGETQHTPGTTTVACVAILALIATSSALTPPTWFILMECVTLCTTMVLYLAADGRSGRARIIQLYVFNALLGSLVLFCIASDHTGGVAPLLLAKAYLVPAGAMLPTLYIGLPPLVLGFVMAVLTPASWVVLQAACTSLGTEAALGGSVALTAMYLVAGIGAWWLALGWSWLPGGLLLVGVGHTGLFHAWSLLDTNSWGPAAVLGLYAAGTLLVVASAWASHGGTWQSSADLKGPGGIHAGAWALAGLGAASLVGVPVLLGAGSKAVGWATAWATLGAGAALAVLAATWIGGFAYLRAWIQCLGRGWSTPEGLVAERTGGWMTWATAGVAAVVVLGWAGAVMSGFT